MPKLFSIHIYIYITVHRIFQAQPKPTFLSCSHIYSTLYNLHSTIAKCLFLSFVPTCPYHCFDASWVGNSADVPFPRVGWFSWNSTCGCLVKFSKHIVIVIIRHIVANTFNWRFNPCHVHVFVEEKSRFLLVRSRMIPVAGLGAPLCNEANFSCCHGPSSSRTGSPACGVSTNIFQWS